MYCVAAVAAAPRGALSRVPHSKLFFSGCHCVPLRNEAMPVPSAAATYSRPSLSRAVASTCGEMGGADARLGGFRGGRPRARRHRKQQVVRAEEARAVLSVETTHCEGVAQVRPVRELRRSDAAT